MPLLDLPVELLQLVFQCCPTPAFIHVALTCRTLFTVASTCRQVVLHHLDLTPGQSAGSLESSSPSTPSLFLLLRKRAAASLYGVECRADSVIHAPPHNGTKPSIDPRACAVRLSGYPNIALVERDGDCVRLYHAVPGAIEPVCTLKPPFEYQGKFRVFRVVFAKDGETVSVLQRYEPPLAGSSSNVVMHPYIQHAMQECLNPDRYHMVHYRRSSPDGPFCYVTFALLPKYSDYEPLAIDVVNPWHVAICWRNIQRHNIQQIILHSVERSFERQKLVNIEYSNQNVLIGTDGRMPNSVRRPIDGPIVKLRLNDHDSQLLLYPCSSLIYSHYQPILTDSSAVTNASPPHRNLGYVGYPDGCPPPPIFVVDIPIFCTHDTYSPGPHLADMCHWQYLSVGVSADPENDLTPAAALLRSEARCQATRCQHTPNLDRGRRLLDWVLVARLLDFNSPTNLSLSGTIAASSRATRLAIATWKTIRIWALEPSELITNNANHFYSSHLESKRGVVDIAPMVLETDAVVFELAFVSQCENELICLTDKGLITWDLGPITTGQRGTVMTLPDTPAVVDTEEPSSPDPDTEPMDVSDGEGSSAGEDPSESEHDQ